MKRLTFAAMMCVIFVVLIACGGGGGGSDDYTPSVYVAGAVSTGTGSNACYWKDGLRVDLPGANGIAYGIAVANGHVYVVGQYSNSDTWCYWIDGVRYDLTGNGYFSKIKVVGSAVYISGTKDNNACVWTNGIYYPVNYNNSYTYGMEIIEDTIYLLGGIGEGGGHAAIWTKPVNGGAWTKYDLPDTGYEYSDAYALAAYDDMIYIVGYLYKDSQSYPALWKGNSLGSLTVAELPTPNKDASDIYGYTYAIKIYNGQPYIAGHYNIINNSVGYHRAALWIGNNDPTLYAPEDQDDSMAFDVCIYNGNVYVAGKIRKPKSNDPNTQYLQPCYWKDGVRVDLSVLDEVGNSITDDFVSANAIVVQ